MICADCATGNHKPCAKHTKEMVKHGGYGACDCQHKTGTFVVSTNADQDKEKDS